MKIKILGIAPGMPQIGFNHASVFVEFNGNCILLDCGEGVSRRLLEEKITPEKVDAIIISHFHPDHCCGIYLLLQMWILQKRKKSLTIYLPENISVFEDSLKLFYLFRERFPFQLNLEICENLNKEYEEILSIQNDHMKGYKDYLERDSVQMMRSYSFLIKDDKSSFLYSSDLESTAWLKQYLNNLDLLILESFHPSNEQIFELANSFKGKIILNHAPMSKMKELLRSYPNHNLRIADEHETITL